MRITKNTNTIISAIVCFFMLVGNAYAQEQGLRWSMWHEGHQYFGGRGLPDKVFDSYIDSMGNTYIFGQFGKDARLGENGPYICPMDSISGYVVGNAYGCFLAKIDSAGTILWCKSVRGATQNHLSNAWNMVVKDDRITIAFGTRFNYSPYSYIASESWLYFCDTLITTVGDHFYKNEDVTYFVTMDLDGNRIDVHDVRLWAKSYPSSSAFYAFDFGGSGNSRFAIDEDDCIHIFSCTEGSRISEDSLHKAYIIVDGDTNRQYPLNIHTQNGRYCLPSVYYKMSSDWHLLEMHPMIDTIVGYQPLDDLSFNGLYVERTVVEGDHLYINGHFSSDDDAFRIAETMTDTDTFSAIVYLDSIHYLKVENIVDFAFMPFLMKLNKNGEIVWVRHLYTECSNDFPHNYGSYGRLGLALDEDNVYSQQLAYFGHPVIFYLDSAHAIPLADIQTPTHIVIVGYDKITGDPIDYYYMDPTAEGTRSQSLAIMGDELIQDVSFLYLNRTEQTGCRKSELCRINKYTKEVSRSEPITFSAYNAIRNMSINENGWVFRSFTGDCARVGDSVSVGPTCEASIMTFFYDSVLDTRIKPCPQVDSLRGSRADLYAATLSWRSRFSHAGYEVAYIPDGGSWDAAATLATSDTSATITLPDDRCYQFRIRGRCGGRRVEASPWSSPITLCPEVGIADVEHLAVTLTPNPTTGMVRIVSTEPMRQVVIYDLSGKEVYGSTDNGQRTTASDLELNLSDLPQGSYIVKVVTTTDRYEYLKLIKK